MTILHAWYETRHFFAGENLKKMVFLVWRGWGRLWQLWTSKFGYVFFWLLFVGGLALRAVPQHADPSAVALFYFILGCGMALLLSMVRPSLFPVSIRLVSWKFLAVCLVQIYFASMASFLGGYWSWAIWLVPIGAYAAMLGFLWLDARTVTEGLRGFLRAGKMWLYNLPLLVGLDLILMASFVVVGLVLTLLVTLLFLPFFSPRIALIEAIAFFVAVVLGPTLLVCRTLIYSFLYSTWTIRDYKTYCE
ncbi:TPA: hypothetical protein DDZ86_03000 [Candidatus Dependentiae bacterium]|nr:MAG: hypothetical protein UW09_C0001G0047 [candidate division TM6 bacterium GW2011_GWF2_43_87]HBL98587.1 hypothetical protein [Candidatus Dependentiae bacterium]